MTTLRNSVQLIGRLGNAPETITFGENKTKVKFSLATSDYYKDKDGEHLIRNYHEGEFVGGLTLLGSLHRLFSLQSITDLTCLMLSREKFAKVLEQFPDLMPKVLKVVVDIVREWEERFLGNYSASCDACKHNIGVSLV